MIEQQTIFSDKILQELKDFEIISEYSIDPHCFSKSVLEYLTQERIYKTKYFSNIFFELSHMLTRVRHNYIESIEERAFTAFQNTTYNENK